MKFQVLLVLRQCRLNCLLNCVIAEEKKTQLDSGLIRTSCGKQSNELMRSLFLTYSNRNHVTVKKREGKLFTLAKSESPHETRCCQCQIRQGHVMLAQRTAKWPGQNIVSEQTKAHISIWRYSSPIRRVAISSSGLCVCGISTNHGLDQTHIYTRETI